MIDSRNACQKILTVAPIALNKVVRIPCFIIIPCFSPGTSKSWVHRHHWGDCSQRTKTTDRARDQTSVVCVFGPSGSSGPA